MHPKSFWPKFTSFFKFPVVYPPASVPQPHHSVFIQSLSYLTSKQALGMAKNSHWNGTKSINHSDATLRFPLHTHSHTLERALENCLSVYSSLSFALSLCLSHSRNHWCHGSSIMFIYLGLRWSTDHPVKARQQVSRNQGHRSSRALAGQHD